MTTSNTTMGGSPFMFPSTSIDDQFMLACNELQAPVNERQSVSLSRLEGVLIGQRDDDAENDMHAANKSNYNEKAGKRQAREDEKTSVVSAVKGRGALFRRWISSSPFVSSFFDEIDKTLARKTRENTLRNRHLPKGRQKKTCSSQGGSSSSSSSASICFAETVDAYYYNGEDHELENESELDAFIRQTVPLKPPNNIPPLEVRLSRARMNYPTDPSNPTSTAVKWVRKQQR